MLKFIFIKLNLMLKNYMGKRSLLVCYNYSRKNKKLNLFESLLPPLVCLPFLTFRKIFFDRIENDSPLRVIGVPATRSAFIGIV